MNAALEYHETESKSLKKVNIADIFHKYMFQKGVVPILTCKGINVQLSE